ncbi:transcription factor Ouib [Drosophila kikkawai]|uniref:Transcription factor Ouib n=1 Tax=Drosophila kikkawai TaxID=30033 RepID=A0A6P4HSH1_DROKI|nr:zinc finger protein 763 [Drosophila kikkawai]
MPFQCRTCAGVIYHTRPKNLFSIDNATMLLNLRQVTGAVINNDPGLPSCICGCCLHDLKLAIVFRERCLQTQKDLLQRGKSVKGEVFEQEQQDDQEEEEDEVEEMVEDEQEEEAEEEECEAQQEEANTDGLASSDVLDDSFEADDFYDEIDACLGVEEEPVKTVEKADTLNTNVTEEFETIYETSTDHEEFFSRLSGGEIEEDCYTDCSFSNSSRHLQPNRKQNSSTNKAEVAENSLTDSSCPASPVQSKSVKQRVRLRGSTSKPTDVDFEPPTTPPKTRKKKPYVTWKNMTEEQIVARKRQQRMRDCVCEQCGRHFKDQSNFKLHMLRHTGIRNFACEDCGRRFYTEHLLSLHQRIVHNGERPYACRFCPKTFHNSTTRVIHERIHTNARPYSCTHCDKSFSSASGRKRHELIHTGVRAYSCSICEQSFQRNTHLKAHLRSKLHAFRAESNNMKEEM